MARYLTGGEFQDTDRFRVVRRLGGGGMGVVYHVFDNTRGEEVALKVLRESEPLAILRFKSEFRSLADITHPNLVTLHELFSQGDQYYFTMELVSGTDFLSYVRGESSEADSETLTAPAVSAHTPGGAPGADGATRGAARPASLPRDLGRLRHAAAQLVRGVEALHAAGKLHRDIKPTNVLVTDAGRVVLLDFGLITDADAADSDSHNRLLVGTAQYMSPEQGASLPVAPASDWYSVGVMLYQALTGRLPFEGPPLAVLTEKQQADAVPPSALVPDVPGALDALCAALLSRHPSRRPGAAAILRFIEGGAPSTPTPAPAARPVAGSAFVGRSRHLRSLHSAMADLDVGRAALVYVHGHSGMGKSALLDRFAREVAQARGATVLAGRCYERESVPYKALDALVDRLSNHLSRLPLDRQLALLPPGVTALARLFPVLSRVEGVSCRDDVAVADPHELRRRATYAMREILRRMSAQAPVVLAIDDLQWGDVDSVALLADVLRPPAPPVLLVVSYRTGGAETSEAVRLLRQELDGDYAHGLRELTVGALTHAESVNLAVSQLVAGGLGADDLADAIAREAGGNPLFVFELVRYVLSGAAGDVGGEGAAVLAPIALNDAIRARVAQLPDDARLLLELVCVAGHPLTEALAVRAAGIDGQPREAVAQLTAAHLIRTRTVGGAELVEGYHDRIRETVMAGLPGQRMAALHARLARQLEASGTADPETLALHYQGAGDDRRAGDHAAQAAEQAAAALAFDRAARLYRLALDSLSEEEIERRRLRLRLGDVLANAGRGAEAAGEYLDAADTAPEPEAVELRRRAAEQLLRAGHIDEGLDAMRSVLDAIGLPLAESPRSALASLVWRRARARMRGLRFTERDAGQIPAADLQRIDACWSVATGLGMIDTIRGADFQTRHVMLALDAGEPYRVARALAVEALYACTAGPSAAERAASVIETASEIADRIDNPQAAGMVLLARGMAAYQTGRYRVALARFEEADAVFCERCTGVSFEIAATRRFAIDAMFNLGGIAEMTGRVFERLREAERRGDLYSAIDMRTGLPNVVWLAADDPDSAHREAQVGMSRWSRSGFHLQHYYDVLARANASLYAGDPTQARRRVMEMWPQMRKAMLLRIQIVRVEATFLRGRAAVAHAAVSGDRASLADARSAAGKLEREPIPAAAPSAALLRANLALLRGEPAATLAELERAIDGFTRADMALMAAICRRQRGEIAGGDLAADASEAEAWMAGQHIRAPARFARLFTIERE